MKKMKYISNIFIAYLIGPFFYFKMRKNEIWMMGFGNNLYENNLKYFNDFLLKKHKEVIIVMDKGSRHIEKITKNRVMYRGHFMTYIYYFYAKVLIFDTCNSDIAPGIFKFNKRSLKVYINHGMEGIKKLQNNYFKKINANIFCSVSDYEKKLKIMMGAEEEKIYITGYPRHDEHFDIREKNILLFFTWRNWYAKDELELKKYIELLNKIIGDEKLNKILEEKNLNMYVNIHAGIRKNIDMKKLEKKMRIKIIEKNESLPEYLKKTGLLITDYSSISWDFIYRDLPVLFYQFDKEKYKKEVGILKEFELGKVGIYIEDYNEFIKKLEKIILNNDNHRIEEKNKYFMYSDDKNCERVYNLILEKKK